MTRVLKTNPGNGWLFHRQPAKSLIQNSSYLKFNNEYVFQNFQDTF